MKDEHECKQTELFALIREDLKATREDLSEVRADVKTLLSFKAKIAVGLTIVTGIMSAVWAVVMKLF